MFVGPSERVPSRGPVDRLSNNSVIPGPGQSASTKLNSTLAPSNPNSSLPHPQHQPSHVRSETLPAPFLLPKSTFSAAKKHTSVPAEPTSTPERMQTVRVALDTPRRTELVNKLRKPNPLSPQNGTAPRSFKTKPVNESGTTPHRDVPSPSASNTIHDAVNIPAHQHSTDGPVSFPDDLDALDALDGIPDEPPETLMSFIRCIELYSVGASSSIFRETLGITVSPKGRWIVAYSSSALHLIPTSSLPYLRAKGFRIQQKPVAVAIDDASGILVVASKHHLVDIYRFDPTESDSFDPTEIDSFDPVLTEVSLGIYVNHLIRSLTVSPDGNLLAVGHDGGIDVILISSTDQRRSVASGPASTISFSSDGRTILATAPSSRSQTSTILSASDFSGPGFDAGLPLFSQPHMAWLSQVIFPEKDLQASQAVLVPSPVIDNTNEMVAYDKHDRSWGIFQISSRTFVRLRLPPSDSLKWLQEGESLEEAFPAILSDPLRVAVATKRRHCTEVRLFQFDKDWHERLEAGDLDPDRYGLHWYQDGANQPSRLLAITDSLKRLIPLDSVGLPPTSTARVYMMDLYPASEPPILLDSTTKFSFNLDDIECSASLTTGDLPWKSPDPWSMDASAEIRAGPDKLGMLATLEKPFIDDGSSPMSQFPPTSAGLTKTKQRKESNTESVKIRPVVDSRTSFTMSSPTFSTGQTGKRRSGSRARIGVVEKADAIPDPTTPTDTPDTSHNTIETSPKRGSMPDGAHLSSRMLGDGVNGTSGTGSRGSPSKNTKSKSSYLAPTDRADSPTLGKPPHFASRQFQLRSESALSSHSDVPNGVPGKSRARRPSNQSHSRQQSNERGSPVRSFVPAHSRSTSDQPPVRIVHKVPAIDEQRHLEDNPEEADVRGKAPVGSSIPDDNRLSDRSGIRGKGGFNPFSANPGTRPCLTPSPSVYSRPSDTQYTSPLRSSTIEKLPDIDELARPQTREGSIVRNIKTPGPGSDRASGPAGSSRGDADAVPESNGSDPLKLRAQFPASTGPTAQTIVSVPAFSRSTPNLGQSDTSLPPPLPPMDIRRLKNKSTTAPPGGAGPTLTGPYRFSDTAAMPSSDRHSNNAAPATVTAPTTGGGHRRFKFRNSQASNASDDRSMREKLKLSSKCVVM